MSKASRQNSESQQLEFVNPLFDADDSTHDEEQEDVANIRINGRAVFKDIGMREYEELEPQSQRCCLCDARNRVCVISGVIIVVSAIVAACVIITAWTDFQMQGSGTAISETPPAYNQVLLELSLLHAGNKTVSFIQQEVQQALRTIGMNADKVGQHLAHIDVSVFGNLSVSSIYQFDTSFANLAYYVEVSFYNKTRFLEDGNIGLAAYIVNKNSINFTAQSVNISSVTAATTLSDA